MKLPIDTMVYYTAEFDGKVQNLSAKIRALDENEVATLTVYAPRSANLIPHQENIPFSDTPKLGCWTTTLFEDENLNSCLISREECELCGIWSRPFSVSKPGVRILGHQHEHDHVMGVYEGESDLLGWYDNGEICIEEHLVGATKDKVEVDKNIVHQIIITKAPYYHECQFPSRTPSGHVAGKSNKYVRATY